MSLLSKKSWHVKSRKNIERVRRDEARAEEVLRLEQDRKLKAEQEFRVRQLKLRSNQPDTPSHQKFNLFEGIEDQKLDTSNVESTIESRSNNRSRYLVQSDANKPWYCSSSNVNLLTPSTSLSMRINDPLDRMNRIASTPRQDPMIASSHNATTYISSNPATLNLYQRRNNTSVKHESSSSPEIVKVISSEKKKHSLKDHSYKSRDRGRGKKFKRSSTNKRHDDDDHEHSSLR